METKSKDEAALRKAIAASPERQKMYGDAWDAIAKAHQNLPSYARERRIFDQAGGFNSSLFTYARTLVRMAAENTKPDSQRLPEYTTARQASNENALYSSAPIHEEFEKLKLADSLGFMVELLGADHPLVKQILNGQSPATRANELIDGTKLKDPAARKEIAAGGQAAAGLPQFSLDRGVEGVGLRLRTNKPSDRQQPQIDHIDRVGQLRYGDIHGGPGIAIESAVANIAGNANDLPGGVAGILRAHAPADNQSVMQWIDDERIAGRPEHPGHGLIDDHDSRRRGRGNPANRETSDSPVRD